MFVLKSSLFSLKGILNSWPLKEEDRVDFKSLGLRETHEKPT